MDEDELSEAEIQKMHWSQKSSDDMFRRNVLKKLLEEANASCVVSIREYDRAWRRVEALKAKIRGGTGWAREGLPE